ncbi:MAG: sensor histidine kinase [Anaerolineales bacterium]
MTLRARLTLWYTGVLGAVLLLFAAVVYLTLSFNLTNQIEQSLSRTADDVLATLSGGMPEDLALTLRALDLTSNVALQIQDDQGEIVWQSANAPDTGSAFDPAQEGTTSNVYSTVSVNGHEYRVLTVPVFRRPDNVLLGFLQLAESLDIVRLVSQTLLLVLIGGGVLALLAAAVIGYLAAGRALAPIEQVTETALQITRADDLSRRIPVMGPPTGEVGHLINAFNETLERLEGLFQTQRRFLADVSHELRTPLTAIRGNVDLIRQMGEADEESLDVITSEVDRLTRLVRDLLLLAQAETGKLPLAHDLIELDTVMLEVFQQARVLAREGVALKIGREDQARVEGDRDRLKQVLLNLVANALENTPAPGKVTLDLICEGQWAVWQVTDTGPGIPESDLPNIFDRFYRRDPSRKRSLSGGAGLGLSIAYWITRSHGGDIQVESKVGQGSTFTVRLPLVQGSCSPYQASGSVEESEASRA